MGKFFVKIEGAYVNPDAIAAIVPDPGVTHQGIQLERGRPNRCMILLTSGDHLMVQSSPDDTCGLFDQAVELADA
jgi:hypothetical protein